MYAGHDARPVGLNVVGLKRAGFSVAQVAAIKKAYRLLYRSGLKLEEALRRIENEAAGRKHAASGEIHPRQPSRNLPRISALKLNLRRGSGSRIGLEVSIFALEAGHRGDDVGGKHHKIRVVLPAPPRYKRAAIAGCGFPCLPANTAAV